MDNKNKYEPVIGLEVHIQTNTKSKMFCSCSTDYFHKKPNTHTCPVCLGLPGAMPVPNKSAIEKCIKVALALNCSINLESKFDRKNYFYPDLPKGFQISQYEKPFGYNGELKIKQENSITIGITRVHQEEDTGKSLHKHNETILDYNKSGVPLVEIVTEPDFHTVTDVTLFALLLQRIIRYIGVSDADMEKGQMRFEPNISVRKIGEIKLPPYRVEIKNIASISVLEKVINKEIQRQIKLLNDGKTPKQETRGLVNMKGESISQRSKANESGYGYFPEPDIPPIIFTSRQINQLKKEIPELPLSRQKRYISEYGLSTYDSNVLTADLDNATYFENVVKRLENLLNLQSKSVKIKNDTKKKLTNAIKSCVNLLTGVIFAHMNKQKLSIREITITPENLAFLGSEIETNPDFSITLAQKVVSDALSTKKDVQGIYKSVQMQRSEASNNISEFVKKVLKANTKAVTDFKSGKNPNAIMFLVGQVMKLSKGAANPNKVKKMLEKKLK